MMRNVQRSVALIVGLVLTVVGVVGFFSGDSLMGFGINMAHNWVHLGSGVLGLAAAAMGWSRSYNQIFGIVYLLVALLGIVAPAYLMDLLNANTPDIWLHLALGVVLAGVGFGVRATRPATA